MQRLVDMKRLRACRMSRRKGSLIGRDGTHSGKGGRIVPKHSRGVCVVDLEKVAMSGVASR